MKNQLHRFWRQTTQRFLVFMAFFAVVQQSKAQTALSYGDAIVTGFNNQPVSSNRQVQILLLKDLTANSAIKITQAGFNNAGTANSASNGHPAGNVSMWTNSTGTTLSAGTVININSNGTTITSDVGTMSNMGTSCACGSTGTTPFLQSTSGGKIFLYYGGTSFSTTTDFSGNTTPVNFNGTPISVIGFQGTQSGYTTWLTSGSTGNFTSYLPSDLNSYNVFLASNTIGAYYNGTRSFASVAAARTAIYNSANWTATSGSGTVTIPTTAFTFPTTPSFTGSATIASTCAGAASNINSNLAITDASTTATETWTVTSGPSNGTLGGFPYSTTATGGTVTPTGLTYTPTAGYTGTDAFTIQVSNGTNTASQTVTVTTVNPQPNPGTITCMNATHVASVCATAFVAHSTSGTAGGTWSSSNTAVGTINPSTGTLGGVLPGTGTTTVSYTVSNSCGTASATEVFTVYALSDTGTLSGLLALCAGSTTTLSSSSTTTPGTGPFNSIWTSSATAVATVTGNGTTTGVVTGVTGGTARISYTVTGCGTFRAFRTVNVTPATTVNPITGVAPLSIGSTLTLSDASTGGTWTSGSTGIATIGSTSGVVTAVANGTATISYQISGSCGLGTATTNITVAGSSLDATISGTNLTCSGVATGSATVIPTGGTAPYSYSWAPSGGTAATASSLAAGSYTCTITDDASGSIQKTVSITQPSAITSSISSLTNVSCNGGTSGDATVSVGGGTPGYTYSWAPSGGTAATATGLAAGSYTCTITDANSCTKTQNATITQPPAITSSVSSITNVSCNGGTNGAATVSASGGTPGYTYSWAPSGGTAATATGLAAGVYTCTITDANSCTKTQNATITQPPAITSSVSSITNVSCNGGTNGAATVSASGGTPGYTYSWAPSGGTAATATGLAAGTYTCTITDANSCTKTQNATITQPPAITSSASSITNVSCNGGTNGAATISASGGTPGYTYSWAPSGGTAATATGLAAGTYTCTITDANSCTKTQNATITQPLVLTSSVSSTTNVSCFGGSNGATTISASGGTPGYTYSWAPSGGTAATATGLAAGTYTCTITDANECTQTQTVTINQPATAVSLSLASQTNVSCNGGSNGTATVTASGGSSGAGFGPGPVGYTYSWAPVGGTAATGTGLAAGTYTCTVTDTHGCTATATVTITEPSAITSSVASSTNVSCNGGTNGAATVSASGGTGSISYSWAPSGGTAATATGLAAGTYTCTITDANSCTKMQTVAITEPTALTSSISSATNVSCNGGSNGAATISAGGGTPSYTYSWAPTGGTAATATGLTAGTYTCTITDANGCTKMQTVTISEPTVLTASISTSTNVSCNGGTNGSATVLASGGTGGVSLAPTFVGYTYSWAPTGGTAATATGLAAGTYTCTVTDAHGCTATATVTITEPSAITSSVASTTSVSCNGGSNGAATITAGGGTGSLSYSWAPTGGTAATATGLTAGTYTCTITDANSCTKMQTVTITEPTVLASSISSSTNVSCNGGSTGAATVSASGGTPSYTYSWAPSGGTAATATGLTAGTYTCIITDANTCTKMQTVTITEPTAVAINSIDNNGPICYGFDLNLTSTASGGTGSISYAWSGPNGFNSTMQNPTVTAATTAATGTYSLTITDANSCSTSATTAATVNPLPAAIGGSLNVCLGLTTNLFDATSGGSWSSSDDATASVSSSGVVTANELGSATITYTLPTGCIQTVNVTVNAFPAAITGTMVICSGNTVSLDDVTTGGSWSSGNTSIATVNATSGVVTSGPVAGSVTISYTSNKGCTVTAGVYNVMGAITGSNGTCIGLTTTLADATAGGTWVSSNTDVATVGTSGIVSALTGGSTTVTYTAGACYRTQDMNMSTTPAPITGAGPVCVGNTLTLNDASTGGTWNCINPELVTVVTLSSNSAAIIAVVAGNATITYSLSSTCKITVPVTVNPLPASITGVTKACPGTTTTLIDATSGGSWISGNTSVATINPTSGVVTGVTAGTALMTYMLPTTCIKTIVVTINPLPAAIVGTKSACIGSTTALSDPTSGGLSWTSSNTAVATINASGGLVTGISAGTATMTYTLGTGCLITTVVTVNPIPAAITGTLKFCNGLTSTLSTTSTGGTWNSGNTAVATIDASGVVTGLAAGTSAITYTIGASCIKTAVVTVTPLPGAITGAMNICQGTTGSLVDAGGGVWTSDNASVVTIASGSGAATGIAPGTANITYSLATGCIATTVVSVNSNPAAITGNTGVCLGATSTLADVTTGGTWTSSNPAYVTIGSTSGVLSGMATGTARITYTIGTGCVATTVATVNALPNAITGTTGLCSGFTTTLSDVVTGGSWTSNDPATASVDAATGIVTGGTAGTTTITYTSAAGCYNTTTVTVNALSAISGTTAVCAGYTTTLSNTTTGGTWSASPATVATIGTNGVVTGVAAGNAAITYSLAGGCKAFATVTVNALPANILGTLSACQGATTNLTDATTGGVWSSSDALTASVSGGLVTGVAAGNAAISYTIAATGCYKAVNVTINQLPATIAGAAAVGIGSTITLTDAITGGNWTSSATSIVSVGSANGVVTALASGTALITYTLPTGCKANTTVTINGMPSPITGAPQSCIGTTTTLSSGTTGGVWSSSNTAVATVGTDGVVTGVATGTSIISYVTGVGSYVTTTVTINPQPASITGAMAICAGSLNTLFDATTGGMSWTSSNPSVATVILLSGVVTGVSAGTTIITYTLNTGCYTTTTVTINPIPAAIGGSLKACTGAPTTLSDTDPLGTWSSNNTAVAPIDNVLGVVTALAAGTAKITYTLPTSCYNTAIMTINASPAAISGAPVACIGNTTSLTDAGGGTWMSDNTAVATVLSGNGVTTGVTAGTANITYTAPNTCIATVVATVIAAPAASTGVATVCAGGTTTLSNTLPGGTWTSSNNAFASVGSATGAVTTFSSTGTVNITYSLSAAGCRTVRTLTINPNPGPITGTLTVCPGAATTLSTSTGGAWSSTNTAVATVGSISVVAGRVAALTSGTTTISYTLPTGCAKSAVVTVNPAPSAGTITSTGGFAINTVTLPTSVTLSSTGDAGGTWTSSAPTKATITSGGVVNAVAAGSTNITYSVTLGSCSAIATHTVTVTAARPGGNTATQANTEISIYPNPTKGTLTINTADAGTFTVYALDGKEIGTYAVAPGATAITLPSGIAAGVYICRYAGDNGNVATVRIVYEQ